VAYALTFSLDIGVRKDRLAAFGWTPGPWLGRLKQCIAADRLESVIDLPDGTTRSAGELADKLTIIRPGKKLAYAADMADTKQNRDKLINLARSAHTLFCETAFAAADWEKASATQHLTTRAAVAIARAAGVERLAPFHFSKRYEHDPGRLYDEIRAAAGSIKIIGGLR
jgi:ribonuclease BN (tRNA processing enzyme)